MRTLQSTVEILLADDDPDDQELFKMAVKRTAFPAALTTVNSGQRLINYLKEVTHPLPSVVFLDINMPGKNGKECLQEIKTNRILKSVPVIMYSTSNNETDIDETYKLGASLYVCKPGSFGDLVLLLSYILRNLQVILSHHELPTYVLTEKSVH